MFFVGPLFFLGGLAYANARVAAVMQPLAPLAAFTVFVPLGRERATLAKLGGIVLAVAGALAVIRASGDDDEDPHASPSSADDAPLLSPGMLAGMACFAAEQYCFVAALLAQKRAFQTPAAGGGTARQNDRLDSAWIYILFCC